jgi:hypothetical protein
MAPIARGFGGRRRDGIDRPSDGLEPSTPSLPSWNQAGNSGHERVLAGTKAPQTEGT